MNAFDTLFSPIASYGIAGYDAVKQGFGSVYSLITNDDYSALDAAESIFAGIKDMHLNAPGYWKKIPPIPDFSEVGGIFLIVPKSFN